MRNCHEILIIEDDESIRDVLKSALEFEGYNVHTANNGQDGLDLLPQIKKPCLILLDLMMPVMDGWTFVENISKIKDTRLLQIPIVVVSAFTNDNDSKLKTVRSIIKKPVDLDQLLEQVELYCEKTTETKINHENRNTL